MSLLPKRFMRIVFDYGKTSAPLANPSLVFLSSVSHMFFSWCTLERGFLTSFLLSYASISFKLDKKITLEKASLFFPSSSIILISLLLSHSLYFSVLEWSFPITLFIFMLLNLCYWVAYLFINLFLWKTLCNFILLIIFSIPIRNSTDIYCFRINCSMYDSFWIFKCLLNIPSKIPLCILKPTCPMLMSFCCAASQIWATGGTKD